MRITFILLFLFSLYILPHLLESHQELSELDLTNGYFVTE